MKNYAVDFETSYTKDRSIGTHGTIGYAAHPDTDIFMVAIVGEEIQYVGPPEEAPWELVRGQRVIAHNFSFEFVMLRELERRGIIKEPLNETGFCTANLAAYLQAPRNLLDASRELLGIQLDKTTGTFTYQRRAATGLTYKILKSTTLAAGSWTEDAAGQVAGTVDENGNETVVVTLSGAKPLGDTKLFVRVAAQ